jgi:hypothetical protein
MGVFVGNYESKITGSSRIICEPLCSLNSLRTVRPSFPLRHSSTLESTQVDNIWRLCKAVRAISNGLCFSGLPQ